MSTTILLVEDNELNRDMLSRRLERKGYVIKMAVDGAQGVSMAMELRPALILMDLSLPVMDGWEATRRLKGNPETATIPIIALTAHARAEDEKTARDAGANDFDTKPVDLNRLVGKIEHLLTTRGTGTISGNE
jgi:two-component system response regulator